MRHRLEQESSYVPSWTSCSGHASSPLVHNLRPGWRIVDVYSPLKSKSKVSSAHLGDEISRLQDPVRALLGCPVSSAPRPNRPISDRFCFPVLWPTAVQRTNLLLFAASLDLPGPRRRSRCQKLIKKKNTQQSPAHSHTSRYQWEPHTLAGRHKSCPLIPALLFCSSLFNWGFEPASFLSGCDEPKIAL